MKSFTFLPPKAINVQKDMGFEILMAVSTKMAVFWVVAPYSLVEVYRRFRGQRLIALMMEAARTSETLVNFYQTTWRYNPEDIYLRAEIYCRMCVKENVKRETRFMCALCGVSLHAEGCCTQCHTLKF
jgi:hypothetical protein